MSLFLSQHKGTQLKILIRSFSIQLVKRLQNRRKRSIFTGICGFGGSNDYAVFFYCSTLYYIKATDIQNNSAFFTFFGA